MWGKIFKYVAPPLAVLVAAVFLYLWAHGRGESSCEKKHLAAAVQAAMSDAVANQDAVRDLHIGDMARAAAAARLDEAIKAGGYNDTNLRASDSYQSVLGRLREYDAAHPSP